MTVSTEVLTTRPTCQTARASLSAYVRAGLSASAAHRVSGHLECCRDCTAIYLELVEGEDPPAAGRLLSGVAIAAVLGGLVMAGLSPFGGAEDSAPQPGPVGAPPVATAPRSGSGGGDGIEKPIRRPHPSATPTPDSTAAPTEPATTSGFAPPGPHATQGPHAHGSDVAASVGHGDNSGGQQSPTPPPAVLTISSDGLAPDLPLPSIAITIPAIPAAGRHDRSMADHRASITRDGRV